VTVRYAASMVLYADGSLIDMDAQGFHFIGLGRVVFIIRYRVRLVFFTAELTALFVTLQRIGEVVPPPEKCLILTDSLSSLKTSLSRKISHRTHPLVNECKQMCSDLLKDGVLVEIMWIPSHVGLEGNKIVDIEWCCF
jgi:hypothetical protein